MTARLAVACVVTALVVPFEALAASQGRSAQRWMVKAVNEVRRAHQLRPLRGSRPLERSAGGFASRLMKLDTFGHTGTIGAGGRMRVLGEALAIHPGRRAHPRRTMRRWMRSPSHAALVLDSRFGYAGAGLSRGRHQNRVATIWVLHLGGR